MTYQEELAQLAAHVGERNRRLLRIAILGRRSGLAAETMVGEIVAASGTPPLTHAEVRRAVNRAMALDLTYAAPTPPRAPYLRAKQPVTYDPTKRRGNPRLTAVLNAHVHPAPPAAPSSDVPRRSFVREMIERGGKTASSADLAALSPQPIPKDYRVQAARFAEILGEVGDGPYFVGTPMTKRTRENLTSVRDIIGDTVSGSPPIIPTHILPNLLTGEGVPDGKGGLSYAREACVCVPTRFTVIEFDEMPLEEQAAFWKGVILAKMLPVRTLVYSGGKSIHGLIMLDTTRTFKSYWQLFERTMASDPDPRYRCDLAFRSPVQMTRVPGAFRPDTNRHQALLYLDKHQLTPPSEPTDQL